MGESGFETEIQQAGERALCWKMIIVINTYCRFGIIVLIRRHFNIYFKVDLRRVKNHFSYWDYGEVGIQCKV